MEQYQHISSKRLPINQWLLTGSALGLLLVIATATAIAVSPDTASTPRELVVEQLRLEGSKALGADDYSYSTEEKIRPGDTLGSLLTRLGIRAPADHAFFRTAPEVRTIGEQLAPWKSVSATVSASGELIKLHFPLNEREQALIVERTEGRLEARETSEQIERIIVVKKGEIRSSLFAATDASDIPDSVTMQLVEIFAGDIDFHRDLRLGDRFVVTYEMDHLRGEPIRSGKVLGAEFINDGRKFQAIWYGNQNGGGYFTEEGKPLKKEFLRSPLEFSRITSGFSRRFHPLLKEWRAHNGVDYGAPTGTKVRATADATVEFAGTQRGYGNIVILKHGSKHSTAYAHLQRFAQGIRKGARVAQGDTIGHVGSTGWATGPHLHYEFRINGSPTNPLSSRLATAPPLSAKELAQFHKATAATRQRIALLSQNTSTSLSD